MPRYTWKKILKRGNRGRAVKTVQEWLTLHGFSLQVDGAFGPATQRALEAFQKKSSLSLTGTVNRDTYNALFAPLDYVQAPVRATGTLSKTLLAHAGRHLRQHPMEVGGQNRGPWVRLYMKGNEGEAWPWCAGFVSYVLKQACQTQGVRSPISTSFSCDLLASGAKQKNRFLRGTRANPDTLPPGSIFLNRRTATDWVHTGIVVAAHADSIETIEGNTNDEGSREGYEVCRRFRGYGKKDFILLD